MYMSAAIRGIKWFYHEFGVDAIYQAGRKAYLLMMARSCRMFAYGTNSLILGMFCSCPRRRQDEAKIGREREDIM